MRLLLAVFCLSPLAAMGRLLSVGKERFQSNYRLGNRAALNSLPRSFL